MKVGKTTLAKDMQALILAFEDGTRAMSGAYAQIMQSWSDIKTVARFLKDDRMKARYKGVAVDTVDLAARCCEKYICNQNGVDSLNEVPYGGGWSQFKKEFEDLFIGITLQGYAVLFISHDKTKEITRPDGTTYTKIVPTLSDSINNIIKNMSDIIAYGYQDYLTNERYMILRSDGTVECGTRFPYMVSKIPFGYDHLVKALNDAIDEEEKHNGKSAVTTEKRTLKTLETLDFDALKNEFTSIISGIPGSADGNATTPEGQRFKEYYQPKISQIIENYLGKGKRVKDCTPAQVEHLKLIVDDLKEMLAKGE